MLKKLFSAFLILLIFFQLAKADVGVGIRWSVEELFLNEFEEKCVVYSIYNPFDTEVTAQITAEGEIAQLAKK